ncbi:MAG: hypothetical protein ACR5LA_10820 [Wolbachia sp.]
MIAGLAKGNKAVEAGKIGDQFEKHFCIGPTSLSMEVYYSTLIYHTFKELYLQLDVSVQRSGRKWLRDKRKDFK